MSESEQQATARSAARAYLQMHDYGQDTRGLDGPPLLGPVVVTRDRQSLVAYRWLGAGRGENYVQVEIDTESGATTVHGSAGHEAFPAWRPVEA